MDKTMSEENLKREVKKKLAPIEENLFGNIWETLKGEGYFHHLEKEEEDPLTKELIVRAKELRKIWENSFGPRPGVSVADKKDSGQIKVLPPGQDYKLLILRQQALSEVYANMASKDDDVIKFRKEFLNGKLLAWDQTQRWILQQAEKEKTLGLPSEILFYATPYDRYAHEVSVRLGGVLDSLRKLSEALAKRYGWSKAGATMIVLSGPTEYTPLVNMITAYIAGPTPCWINGEVRQTPASTRRITLEIDPTLPKEYVAEVYRQARGEVLGRDKRGNVNYKPQKEKALRLAQFYARQPEKLKAKERMGRWNMEHRDSEFEYSQPFRLNDHCKAAAGRLLNPGFKR